MASWTCPSYARTFGARGRRRVCSPGVTLDEFARGRYPATGLVIERIIDAVRAVDSDEELIVDPISKAVLLKRDAVFCTVTPKTRWVAADPSSDPMVPDDVAI